MGCREKNKENEDGVEQANLVVLAGSLYLVTDFYRFLNQFIVEIPMDHDHLL